MASIYLRTAELTPESNQSASQFVKMAELKLHSLLITLLYLSISLMSFPHTSSASIISAVLNSPSFASLQAKSQWERLNLAAYESLTRANNIKYYQSGVSPHLGAYTVSLQFGTPPQALTLLLDTGSSVTWIPCTDHYNCSECHPEGNINEFGSIFIPEQSNSSRVLECRSPECQEFHVNNLDCDHCPESYEQNNCSQVCPYNVAYGIGSTSGFFLSETLHFSEATDVTNFVVGCSTKASQMSVGIAGFGRYPVSLPSQLGVKRFSYCLVSHKFDDTSKTSELIMVREEEGGGGGNNTNSPPGIVYTPIMKVPPLYEAFYYITVTNITVGSVDVKVPDRYLVFGPDGNGGTIVDSGTTFTVMDDEVFRLVLTEYEKQMGQHYPRADDLTIGDQVNLTCYNVTGQNPGNYPELNFYFEGGGKMAFSISDSFEPYTDAVCMTVFSARVIGGLSGPSIILGNFQQQNVYVEFDLENQRLGFRNTIC